MQAAGRAANAGHAPACCGRNGGRGASLATALAVVCLMASFPAAAQEFQPQGPQWNNFGGRTQQQYRPENRQRGRAVGDQAERDAAIAACVRETSRRFSVSPRDVQIGTAAARQPSAARPVLRVDWFLRDGQRGRCEYSGDTLTGWEATPTTAFADASCIQSVAARIRKRPQDIDVLEIEGDPEGRAAVFWETYQGQRGRCEVNRGLVEKVEFE